MKSVLSKFIKQYPITFVFIIMFAVLSIMAINLGDVYQVTDNSKYINEWLLFSLNTIFASFMLYKIMYIYKSIFPSKLLENFVLKSVVIIAISLVIYILSILILNCYMDDGIFGLYNLIIFYILIIYFLIIKEKNIDVSEYLIRIFINFLFVFLIYCIIVTGIGILIFIYNSLITKIDYNYILNLYIFMSVVVGYMGFLMSIDFIEQKLTFISKVLIKYIMCNMVLIGFLFFYIYLIKIIISLSLPSNQVFAVCTVLFVIGLPVALMCRFYNDNKIYDKIIEYLPFSFIPALVLQILSLFIRINNYGMTITRYEGFIIIISEIIYLVFYIFEYKKFKYIYIAYSILFIIMTFVPLINQYQFPNIFNSVFK